MAIFKSKQLVVASSNKNKLLEINKIFKLLSLSPLKGNVPYVIDVKEDKGTFIENSVIKAVSYGNHFKTDVIADDSGLVLDLLDGEPGVFSARYCKKFNPDKKKCSQKDLIESLFKAINEKVGNNLQTPIKARFVCAISLFSYSKNVLISVEGSVEGEITLEPKGENGFGYDPIFIPVGFDTTFAQMKEDQKNTISHRFNAIKKLLDLGFLE